MGNANPFTVGLDKNAANYAPLSLLARTAHTYPRRVAVIHGDWQLTWGEVPCAFVELKDSAWATETEIIEHCRGRLAHFKAPKRVVFGPLPKTSTGKIQKFVLRDRVKSASAIDT